MSEDVQITIFTGACGVGKTRRLLKIGFEKSARILRNSDLKTWLIDGVKPCINNDTIIIGDLGEGLHYTMMSDLWVKLFELVDDGATLFVSTHRKGVLGGLSANLPELKHQPLGFVSKPRYEIQVRKINGQGKEDSVFSALDLKVCIRKKIEIR